MVMAVSLWLRVPSLPADGITWALPIAPGREIAFTLWTHDLAFSTAYTTGGLTRQTPGPLRLTVWYQHGPAAKPERLVVLKVSAWPLVIVAAMLAIAGGWLWRGAKAGALPASRRSSR